ncbi:IclR family transcriptional regulator C-terminal domain-containing protein [Streptomyces sp. NPDC050560]|uniref:IclR family transcriptional regulator domain-containing protein n=1 Tax=Streptomyces sp. NPDC050560 TaxID=3365630 RepID=UPI0037B7C36E
MADDGENAGTGQPAPGQGYVQSLARGLAVIRSFDDEHPEMTLSEVARRTGLARAAARRFLLTLIELGYIQSDGRLFRLRPRVLELGYAYLSSVPLPRLAEPHLEKLVDQVHRSASLAILDGTDIVYVARTAHARIMAVSITVGTRFPAYCTSMGRVLLAALSPEQLDGYFAKVELAARTPKTVTDENALRTALDQVRSSGVALVNQEFETGLRSMAVPVHDRTGATVAAMNISLPTVLGSLAAAKREILPPLREAARQLGEDLKRVPALPPLSTG